MTIIFLLLFMVLDAVHIRWKHSYKEGIMYMGAMLNLRLTLLLISIVLRKFIPLSVSVSAWYLYLSVMVSPFEYYLRLVYKRMLSYARLGYFYMTINMSGVVYQSILINAIYYFEPDVATGSILVMTYPLFYIISRRCLVVIKEHLDYTKQEEHKKELESGLMPIIREIHMVQHEYANILSGFLDSARDDVMYKGHVYYINREKDTLYIESGEEKDFLFQAYWNKIPMVRNVLLSKSRKTRGLNIDLHVYSDIPVHELEAIPLSEYELVTILANLIDNAVEALIGKCHSTQSRGMIVVHLNMTDTGMILKVGNSHNTVDETQINEWFRMGYTTKSDATSHGFGLHIVKSIMMKYGGHYFYEAKNGNLEQGQAIRYICLYIPKQEVVL